MVIAESRMRADRERGEDMVGLELKKAVYERDVPRIVEIAGTKKRLLSKLYGLTFSTDAAQVWRAIEALGIVAALKAPHEIERIRDFLRRCIWQMTDESGGLGWHSPEVIGEVLYRVPALIPEFGHLLFPYFSESPFERAAVARIAPLAPALIRDHRDQLLDQLRGPDAMIRIFAARSLRHAGLDLPPDDRRFLGEDHTPVSVYCFGTGTMESARVCDLFNRPPVSR